MDKMRGADMLVIGMLIWIIWKEYNPGYLGNCIPGTTATNQVPNSTLLGPGWTRGVQ
jgi:hypothetical protein